MKTKFKLTRGGIQYLDAGGTVMNPAPNGVGQNDLGGYGRTDDPTSTAGVAGIFMGNPNVPVATVGNQIQGFGKDFTAQNTFQAQLAPTMQTNYGGVINSAAGNALNGYGQFNQNLHNQNALAQQLMLQSQGYGPNPASAQLANTTGQNVATQASLMAGQRGSNQNAGLLARQIANQGAGIQQNAVGQGAALQAQQQLAAQGQLQGLYGNIGNQITGQQTANTGLFTGAAGAQNAQNTGIVNNYSMAQGINAQTAQNNANAVNKTTGGLTNSLGSIAALLAHGGEVEENPKVAQVPQSDRYPKSLMPSHLKSMADIYHPHYDEGGVIQIPNFLNPPEEEKKGGLPGMDMLSSFMDVGGKVPGKAQYKGDTIKNDVVDAKLSPGEAVIPRSIMQSDDPVGNAAKFVADLVKKDGRGNEEEDFKTALKKAISQRKTK